ncbi:alpha/beta hydrolase family protein [Streptomyces tanashiensis]|uniref:Acetylhydrolase n=1 Tax=Streptomyces tanashiensis TaxID=67367 RepID=A0ABY6R162_9ACTN|nr:acetylhydrolase [Streptomyces tanashiensis]UZX23750.1 acetylhydrolase [Streptomyces tanashiensis]GGY51675.1 lipase [Streptomyces tanashiensis]
MSTHPVPSRRTVAKGALLGAAAVLFGTSAARAAEGPAALRLPAPTGPHPVGLRTFALTDTSRVDPWEPGVRQVMISVLYPARTVRGFRRAPQLTPAEAREFAGLAPLVRPGLPAAGVDWGAVLTQGHVDAPPLPGRRPVLLYTPGGGDSRTLGTTLAEDLASHGRIVVLVDHPGDASQVELPGGMRWTVLTGPPDPATFRTMIDTRVADLRFVLDRLGGLPLAPVMDLRRIGVYGHSAGGTAAVHALARDGRIAAGVNLEGHLDLDPDLVAGLDRPLLMFRTDGFEESARIERSWAGVRARRVLLPHANHWIFSDYAYLVPQLQAAGLVTAGARAALVGPGDPAAATAVVRRGVRSFFDRRLPAAPAGTSAADSPRRVSQ